MNLTTKFTVHGFLCRPNDRLLQSVRWLERFCAASYVNHTYTSVIVILSKKRRAWMEFEWSQNLYIINVELARKFCPLSGGLVFKTTFIVSAWPKSEQVCIVWLRSGNVLAHNSHFVFITPKKQITPTGVESNFNLLFCFSRYIMDWLTFPSSHASRIERGTTR